jgi:hypothetical protein
MKQHLVSLNFSTFGLTTLITECLPVSLTVCAPHLHNVSRHNLTQSNFTVGTDWVVPESRETSETTGRTRSIYQYWSHLGTIVLGIALSWLGSTWDPQAAPSLEWNYAYREWAPFCLFVSFENFDIPWLTIVTLYQAAEDDVLPLSKPLVTASGETVDRITVVKGARITSPIRLMNRSEAFWGPTAKQFLPERWLDDGSQIRAKEIQGHRHLLTFVDGPRTCLGKGFALAEFKVCTNNPPFRSCALIWRG